MDWGRVQLAEPVPPELLNEAVIAEAAGEPPGRRQDRSATPDVAADRPRSPDQQGPHQVIVEERRGELPPGVPTTDRLADRGEDAEC